MRSSGMAVAGGRGYIAAAVREPARRASTASPACASSSSTPSGRRPPATRCAEQVRAFLARERAAGSFVPVPDAWSAWSPEFSRRCGAAGFIGLTLPREYGGHGRSALEKFVVTEEMLAAGARSPLTGSPTGRARRRSSTSAASARAAKYCRASRGRVLLRDRHERARLGLRPCLGAHEGDQGRRRLVIGGTKSGRATPTTRTPCSRWCARCVRRAAPGADPVHRRPPSSRRTMRPIQPLRRA